jgi:hypothetical protein
MATPAPTIADGVRDALIAGRERRQGSRANPLSDRVGSL